MQIHQLTDVCRQLIFRFKDAVGLSFTAVISRYYYTFASLSKAYSEVSLGLLSKKFVIEPSVVCAAESDVPENLTRITPEIEKRLMLAASGRRSLFEDILYREVGIKTHPADKWMFGEMRQAVATASWILRTGERNQGKLIVLDSLTEILMKAVDSFDRDEALDILDQMIQERFPQSERPRQSENVSRVVNQIREYIDGNYFEDLSLSILSDMFHKESSSLSRAFKKTTGVNLMFYITQTRVERAKEYLHDGKLSIKEISELVGYGDYAYFSRIFRKMTGKSPKNYQGDLEDDAVEN
jgi:AraC-like DNA-binding protein